MHNQMREILFLLALCMCRAEFDDFLKVLRAIAEILVQILMGFALIIYLHLPIVGYNIIFLAHAPLYVVSLRFKHSSGLTKTK